MRVQGEGWQAIVCGSKRSTVSDHDLKVIQQHVADRKACHELHPGETSSLDCPRCRRDLGFLGPGF